MGASQSTGSTSGTGGSNPAVAKNDSYELLGVEQSATEEE